MQSSFSGNISICEIISQYVFSVHKIMKIFYFLPRCVKSRGILIFAVLHKVIFFGIISGLIVKILCLTSRNSRKHLICLEQPFPAGVLQ